MDKIMSKINDTSNLGHDTLDDHRPLADSELELVSGGLIHEGTHAAGSLTLGGGGTGGSLLEALASVMGDLMTRAASGL